MKTTQLRNISNYRNKRGNKGHRSKIVTYGYEARELEVIGTKTSGRVDLHPSWIGKRVKIIRMD
jgi:hypothetical protein